MRVELEKIKKLQVKYNRVVFEEKAHPPNASPGHVRMRREENGEN